MDRKKLVDQSIDYIMQHLNDELSLDTVAAHFFISKYHFSRIFKEATGESIYAFIKRCKVDQSAVDIKLQPTRSLPAHVRRVPFAPKRTAHFKTAEEYAALIERQTFDDIVLLYERFIGSYADLEKNWYQFLDTYQAYLDESTILVERFFNDPSITPSAQCICDIGMTLDADCRLSNVLTIPGGQWLVYPFAGTINDIYETLQGIFSVYLPQSGCTMSRPYGLNIYHHIDRDARRVVLDLCIPLT